MALQESITCCLRAAPARTFRVGGPRPATCQMCQRQHMYSMCIYISCTSQLTIASSAGAAIGIQNLERCHDQSVQTVTAVKGI